MYPVMVDLRNRPCLVVGGGSVAARKVDGLLSEGARITVVALEPIEGLEKLAEAATITLERRGYRAGEAADYALAFAATDDRAVNRGVYQDATAANVLVNVADDPELCSFQLPGRLQRGPMQLAVASGGNAPFVVRRLRQLLARRFGHEWTEWIEAAARFRSAVLDSGLPRTEQEARFDHFFQATVDPQELTARVPTTDELKSWASPSSAATAATPLAVPSAPGHIADGEGGSVGFVSLVGAGPGDSGLMTVRGRQRLLAAEAVAYDRLAAPALPTDLPAHVELHCVGKQPGRHPTPQEEINALLVRLAREGKRVVRLKGGDPYVFGRGGEEAETLRDAGIPFEVVPAVTSGVAVPAYAGIPVTHRGEVVRVTMVTAHEAAKRGGPQVRWDLIAGDAHTTIIGYMGVLNLPNVVDKLLAAGMDPATPAAMIERGTTSRQRTVYSELAKLVEAIERARIRPPAIFVVGPAVRHAQALDWYGTRPLLGERIGIVAPAKQLTEELELLGVEVVQVPLPVTPSAHVVMAALPLTGWVFRNAEEVEAFDEERHGAAWSTGLVSWCLNRQAAERARELGWTLVELLEESGPTTASKLASGMLKRRRSQEGCDPQTDSKLDSHCQAQPPTDAGLATAFEVYK